jgi:hypothetical protein
VNDTSENGTSEMVLVNDTGDNGTSENGTSDNGTSEKLVPFTSTIH